MVPSLPRSPPGEVAAISPKLCFPTCPCHRAGRSRTAPLTGFAGFSIAISEHFLVLNSREQIIRLQGQVDKQYAGLKDMAEERKRKLENMYHLFQLKREADDLEQWIAEKELVVSSPEMGQDFDHVTVSTHSGRFLCLPLLQEPSFQTHTHTPARCKVLHRDACPTRGGHSGSPGEV